MFLNIFVLGNLMEWTRKNLIQKYLEFFKSKGHAIIPSASLIPENDPTVLFTTAGMHPLVLFLLGEKHPLGKRIVDVQKCLRTVDIEKVGGPVHLTFFEMLGNWGLGDYFKKEAIEYSYEFLTGKKWLGLEKEKLAVSCFKGDKDAGKDEESYKVWLSLGIPKERIVFLPKEDNWWGPAGETGPCGPDTEMFYWTGKQKAPKKFEPKNERWVEIWNDVFMEYNKIKTKAILVDAINCLIDKGKGLDKEIAEFLNNLNVKIIIVTNTEEKEIKSKLEKYNFDVFTLLKNPDKSNLDYFKILLDKYKLKAEEVIYFDHKEENIKSAKSIGITSELYKNNGQVEKFIEENIFKFIPLKQKNVDTGMGVERTVMILQGKNSVYEIEIFQPIMKKIQELSKIHDEKAERIIVDHLRSATFILGDDKAVTPSNLGQGYVLRRLIRSAIRHGRKLEIINSFTKEIAEVVISIYHEDYPELKRNRKFILHELEEEENKFGKVIENGLKQFNKLLREKKISGKEAFLLYQSYGFPIEMTEELSRECGLKINKKEFEEEFKKHQELSRTATKGMFGSGLADHSEATTKLHTTTHLLHAALRRVLGSEVKQKGSNITAERLRFDISFSRKLTDEEIKKVESLVNEKIKQRLEVKREEMTVEQAKNSGALGFFEHKYGGRVSVYSIGNFSKEICTGPHVKNTKDLGKFKIVKEEAVAAGVRRIKAVLNND